MTEREFNTFPDGRFHLLSDFRSQASLNADPAQRNGQGRGLFPPFPQIQQFDQSILRIGEPSFMDNNAIIGFPVPKGRHDPVKGHGHGFRCPAKIQGQEKKGGCPQSGNRDSAGCHIVEFHPGTGHNQRPAAPAESRSGPQEGVCVQKIPDGRKRQLGNMKKSASRILVQGFHIFQKNGKSNIITPDQTMGQGMKQKRIIGAGGVSQCQLMSGCRHDLQPSRSIPTAGLFWHD